MLIGFCWAADLGLAWAAAGKLTGLELRSTVTGGGA
jgi:hypothetical protein